MIDLLGLDGPLAQAGARRGGRLLIAGALGECEHRLPERPRLVVAAGGVEGGRELVGGAVVGRIRGEHLPELGRSSVRVALRVERVEAGLHRRRLVVGGGFWRAAGERDREGHGDG